MRFDPFTRACIEEGMLSEGAPDPECARDGTLTLSGGGMGEPRRKFSDDDHQEFLLRGELLKRALGGNVRAELVELLRSRELVGEEAEYLLRHLDEGSLAQYEKVDPRSCEPLSGGAGDPAAAHWPTGWSRAFLGMDLGRNDPSAFVLMKDQCVPVRSANGGRILLGPRERTVVWADRVRDTSYTDLAAYVGQLLARDQLRNTTLTIDATGLGGPFSDTLIQGGIEHFALTMTAGAQMNRKGYRVTCSKNLLLETLASGFETGELTIASDLPLRNQLIQEIAAFELATTAAGNLVLEGGGKGHHSDMAIACALAYLTSEKLSGQPLTMVKLLGFY